jgi:hypothetical protein
MGWEQITAPSGAELLSPARQRRVAIQNRAEPRGGDTSFVGSNFKTPTRRAYVAPPGLLIHFCEIPDLTVWAQ